MDGTPTSIGRFRIVGLVGAGAMGVVYRGRDDSLDRDVAVKVMRAEMSDEDSIARFRREARAAARLQHPNIVTIYELGESEGALFQAMELLHGHDLLRVLRAGPRPPPAEAVSIVLQVLDGLGHAHARGIVHRDLKPSNVFLVDGRRAKILDFGVARLGEGLTVTGHVVGTPSYMSPEQVRAETVDGRSDLFSVGLILYELLTGVKAYYADSMTALLQLIAREPPNLSRLPLTPEWAALRRVLDRALARQRDDRYADAESMAAELSAAVLDLERLAEPAAPTIRERAPTIRERAPAVADRTGTIQRPPTSDYRPPTIDPPPPVEELDLPLRPATVIARPTTVVVPEATVTPAAETAPPSNRGWLVVAATVAVAFLGIIAVWKLWPRPPARPGLVPPSLVAVAPASPPVSLPPASPTRGPATPETTLPAPTAPPTTLPAAPSPLPTSRPTAAPPTPAVSPREPARPAEVVDVATRLERANQHYEAGRLRQALADAQSVLRVDPANREAAALVEDIQVDIATEARVRNVRQALDRGEFDVARRLIEEGLRAKPNDGRLMALRRQLPPP